MSAADAFKHPRCIVLIKGHSAGVGDILRSSAAWRALKDRFGNDVALHVVLISREPGYVSGELMKRHHLLAGYHVIAKAGGWRASADALADLVRTVGADLVIDCEPSGLRTSTLCAWLRLRLGVATLGIAEFPGRALFYTRTGPSMRHFASDRRKPVPMDYTDRDFVALAGLGVERDGRPIELVATLPAEVFAADLLARGGLPTGQAWLGLNIGCGTPDALPKRPDLALVAEVVAQLQAHRPMGLLLTGAPFERDINQAFLSLYAGRTSLPVIDLAGQTDLVQLAGVIKRCQLFLSTDSGPYHMAVGLKVPTLALFNRPAPSHYHHDAWVRCVQLTTDAQAREAAQAGKSLLALAQPNQA